MGWYCKKCGYAGFGELPKSECLENGEHNCAKMKREEKKEFARVDKLDDKYKAKIKEFGECLSTCHCGNQCHKHKFHTGNHFCPVIYSSGCRWHNELDDFKAQLKSESGRKNKNGK